MEEDIKILEEMIKEVKEEAISYDKYCYEFKVKQAQSLENLLKAYKELEEMLKNRIKYTNELEKDLFENACNYVIPKSKVKEKIEELEYKRKKYFKKELSKAQYTKSMKMWGAIQVLKELLEEE